MNMTKTLAAAAVVMTLGATTVTPALASCNATVVVHNNSNDEVQTWTVWNQKKGSSEWARMNGNNVTSRTLKPGESTTMNPVPLFRKPTTELRWKIAIKDMDGFTIGSTISNYGMCKNTVQAHYTGS
jgi:hypothetical protein